MCPDCVIATGCHRLTQQFPPSMTWVKSSKGVLCIRCVLYSYLLLQAERLRTPAPAMPSCSKLRCTKHSLERADVNPVTNIPTKARDAFSSAIEIEFVSLLRPFDLTRVCIL